MTVDSTRIFGCPTCGFRVSGADGSCPRCGLSFSSETKFECPFCGEHVDQGSSECPSCHVNYGEFKQKTEARGGDDAIDSLLLEIIQLEAQSARTETKKFSCPGCSWMVDSGTDTCPRCGRDLTSDEEAFQCPICGSAVSANDSSCPECGSSFEVGEEAEAPEKITDGVLPEVSGAAAAEDALETPTPTGTAHEEQPSEEPEREVQEAPTTVVEEPMEAAPEIHFPEERTEREEEEKPPAEDRPEPPAIVKPIRVVPRPAPKAIVRSTPEPEPEPEKPEPAEAPKPEAEAAAEEPKKQKQRKLKTRVVKKR